MPQAHITIYAKLITLVTTALLTTPVFAQSAGNTIVSAGLFHIKPNDSSETLQKIAPIPSPVIGSGASMGNENTFALAITHFFSDNLAFSFDAGIPPTFQLRGMGSLSSLGELGSAKQWSPAVVGKWYFGKAEDRFRPFIGAGFTYVHYSDVELTNAFQIASSAGGTAQANLSSSFAPVINLGASYQIDPRWHLLFSVSYVPLKTSANIIGITPNNIPTLAHTRLTINPTVAMFALGYKF